MSDSKIQRVLVCGATGYVGGRLVPMLLEAGFSVRCLVRSPQKMRLFPWVGHPRLEVVAGNLDDANSVRTAAEGVDAAYYLVHSMISAGVDYAERDRQLATNFVSGINDTSCRRIIYLGGLGELGKGLSQHLESRGEVAEILESATCDTTVFRAAMIIGSGSASFEILRYLVERLPAMVTPKWVRVETQPIAIRDVLRYLTQCLTVQETADRTIDIGGAEILTYQQIMKVMAEARELPGRFIVPVPVLTPKLSSLWISLVTPVDAKIARPLAEGLRNRTVCRNDDAQRLMPGPLFKIRQAIEVALGKTSAREIDTRWSTAGEMPGDPDWAGGTTLSDARETEVDASADAAFDEIRRIGGRYGYWGADWLWWFRGAMDKLIGGPGLRRGRRHPTELTYGEVVDFWRVAAYESGSLLQLRAEMILPGEAVLEFRVESLDENKCRVVQTAKFRPKGLFGLAYWYAVYPLHFIVFPKMLRGIRMCATKSEFTTADKRADESMTTATNQF